MKLADSSVISEPVEFIFNLLNLSVTKHIFFHVCNSQIYPEHPVYI